MSRNAAKILFSALLITVFLSAAYGAKKAKTNIFCVGDSIVLGNVGTYTYSDMMQSLFDKQYGQGKVAVYNYSFFDMNTTQSLRLISDLILKKNQVEAVVIMAGEANFYNLNGYTDYLSFYGKYFPQIPLISEADENSLEKLNIAVASVYGSPLAHTDKAVIQQAFFTAYKSIIGSIPKMVGGFSPKVVPAFYVLSEDPVKAAIVDPSFANRYKAAWDLINAGRKNEAEKILKEMAAANPFDSRLYYALGSLYMADGTKKLNQALRMFEEGILINPFDTANQCYKGLSIMYMSYDGIISSEILYFSKVMKSFLGEAVPEINAICAMDTTHHADKMALIGEWIVSDMEKINEVCKNAGIRLIIVDYPLDARVNALLKKAFAGGGVVFVDNSGLRLTEFDPATSRIYVETARNVISAIDNNNIIRTGR